MTLDKSANSEDLGFFIKLGHLTRYVNLLVHFLDLKDLVI